MNETSLTKTVLITSIILGAIMGISAIVPIVSLIILALILNISAPLVLIYLKSLKLIKEINIDESIKYGAISGFFAGGAFCFVFFPVAFIIDKIFRPESYLWVKVVCSNAIFVTGIIFFIALLSMMLNMFTGFLTAYFYQYFKKGN